ncbi:uncharacterized protein LOC116305960 isoform X2 [Actinia tenebrosa]|uniref:Uncharacterized protein LOC116305960 isoform X2 n=1 Tax=Actinia tenebrosa TaxID=6105 RepID=A0A6P8IWQ0_ACTTE|nr:uncharacterized protein LOC116305960 isoform X2 [Actinia tenebrosa]
MVFSCSKNPFNNFSFNIFYETRPLVSDATCLYSVCLMEVKTVHATDSSFERSAMVRENFLKPHSAKAISSSRRCRSQNLMSSHLT